MATFPVDHVVPSGVGGTSNIENLALACPRCNALKWMHTVATDPLTGEEIPILNPRRQNWSEHFQWSTADPAVLEPVTATGRATIHLLDLNSESHLTIRRLLVSLGMHP